MIIDQTTLFQTAAAMMDAANEMIRAMADGDTPPLLPGAELDALVRLVQSSHGVVETVLDGNDDPDPQDDLHRATMFFNARCGGAETGNDFDDYGSHLAAELDDPGEMYDWSVHVWVADPAAE